MTAPYAPRHARPANPPGEARADQWRGRPAGSGAHGTAPDPGGHPYPPSPDGPPVTPWIPDWSVGGGTGRGVAMSDTAGPGDLNVFDLDWWVWQ